ncbi:phage tail tape measure protein [Paenibacillus sp. UASWS1643]|uniref:phage tail tape measure protein n=1 Tax=Paenibacillus sp. UASWS1643 TaxID=2580422 RepID=UPI00123B9E28|nr:phage tail tape measure protein [Paenibacillus sp. UASWS1643]KAA8756528.1 phage tail tape measure protein [Paenibacillus sp. UASWS1643]
MAVVDVGGIRAVITADISGYNQTMDKAKTKAKELGEAGKSASSSFSALNTSLAGVGASAAQIEKINTSMRKANPDLLRRQLEAVRTEMKRLGASSSEIDQVTRELEKNAKAAKGANGELKTLGLAYMALSAAMAGVIAKAVETAATFEQSMAKVKAISGATAEEFENLRNQALELGATTVFTASQSADAMGFLAMAGFKTTQIMQAMPGVLNLAAAGQMEIARTADIASNILTGFQLEAGETGRVVDVLAKAMTSSNTNIEQLGYGMKYLAPVAASLGVSIEEAATAVGVLSNAGIQGEMAGTQLRAILLRLVKPPKQAREALAALNVTLQDTQGNFLPLGNVIGQLERAFGGLTQSQQAQAASMIAGVEATSGFLTLINNGQASFDSFTDSLINAGGTAQEIAEIQMDTLKGAIIEMTSALEGVGITVGDKFAPAVRMVTEEITGLLLGFNNLDPAMQTAIIAFTTATPLIMGGVMAIRALSVALWGLATANPILLAVSITLGLVAAGVSALVSSNNEAAEAVKKHDEAQRSLNETLAQSPLDRSVAEVEALQEKTSELNVALEERAKLQQRLNEIEALQSDGLGTPALLDEMIDINEELADMDDNLRTMGYDGVEDATSKLGMLNRTIEESTPALLKMKDAEIQEITAKYRQVEASEALLGRYKELASAQTLDQSQKQELASTVDQLRKKYPDLNRVMDESGRVRVQNIDIIGDHIAAERSFIDQSAQVVNAYVANMKAMAEANLASVKAQISNYENLAKAMSSVGGIQSAPFKKNVTGIGGVSVNPTFERLANEESTILDGLYDKQVKAQQAVLDISRALDGLSSGDAYSAKGVGSGIDLTGGKDKKSGGKGKKAKSSKAKKEKSAAEIAKELRDKAYNADLATIRYQADMYDWSAEQQTKAYEKLRKAHAQHLKETVEDSRTLNLQLKRLQEDSVKARYDFSSTWIDKDQRRMEDAGKSEVEMANSKLAAWTRVRDRYKKDSEEYKKADEQVYQARKDLAKADEKAVADAYSASEKWIGKEERRMEAAGKSEAEITQMKIAAWTRIRDRHKKDSEYYERAEDQLYSLRKKLTQDTEKLATELVKVQKTAVEDAKKAELDAIEERKKAFVSAQDEKIAAIDALIAKEAEYNSDADYSTQLAEKNARIDLLTSAVSPEGIQEREDLIKERDRMILEHERDLRKRELESQKSALQDEKDERTSAFDAEKTQTEAKYDALKAAFDAYSDDIKFIESAIGEFRKNANAAANTEILTQLDSFVSEYNAKMASLAAPVGGANVDLTEYNANKDAWAAAKASGDTAEMARLTARNEELRKLYGIDKDTGKLQQFKVGGVVQGAAGSAVPVIAHAGEMILNDAQIGNLFRLIAAGPSETSAPTTVVTQHIDMSVAEVNLTDRVDVATMYDERARVVSRLQSQGIKQR